MQKNYLILIALAISLVASFGFGYRTGGNAVKVEYQSLIDTQKNEAEALRERNDKEIEAKNKENEAIKATIEKERQSNVKKTNDIRNQLNASGLRFKPSTSGASGADKVPSQDGTSSNSGAAKIELPASITADLRELAYDCDTLLNDYEALFNFVWDIK